MVLKWYESVCVCVEWTWNMHYLGLSTYEFIPYYASATCILKPFEDSEPTGLKVDTAGSATNC